MKQKLFVFLAIFFLIIAIIGLNAVSYTQKDELPDSEEFPNRSTYNTGATGTRAFYELLEETGRKVIRRRESFLSLTQEKNKINTLVIFGDQKSDIEKKEIEQLFKWVTAGGRLILIDRTPAEEVLKSTANYRIVATPAKDLPFGVDPSNVKAMTDKTVAAKPLQPTILTRNVNAVQPSRFASTATFEYYGYEEPPPRAAPSATVKPDFRLQGKFRLQDEPPPPPRPKPTATAPIEIRTDKLPTPLPAPQTSPFPVIEQRQNPAGIKDKVETVALDAPFAHLSNGSKNILIDFPYGEGKIIWLTDPYIVSNAGIEIVDNLQLAVNLVSVNDGTIAFDEYHQGYGEGETRLMQYFAGTPVIPIIGQICLLLFLIFLSQSRRFARALPETTPSRLSKLEYVSAFAELQRRTKAYDLAMENIYSEFRRKAARLFGTDNFTITHKELAKLISERGKFNELEIYNLIKRCEEIIQGDATNKKEVLHLTTRIREIEEALNIKRTRKTV